jgi:hypothetical protein
VFNFLVVTCLLAELKPSKFKNCFCFWSRRGCRRQFAFPPIFGSRACAHDWHCMNVSEFFDSCLRHQNQKKMKVFFRRTNNSLVLMSSSTFLWVVKILRRQLTMVLHFFLRVFVLERMRKKMGDWKALLLASVFLSQSKKKARKEKKAKKT